MKTENWKVRELPGKIQIVQQNGEEGNVAIIAEMQFDKASAASIIKARERARLASLAPAMLQVLDKTQATLAQWRDDELPRTFNWEQYKYTVIDPIVEKTKGINSADPVKPRKHVWVTVYDDIDGKTIDRYTVAITHEGQPTEWYGMSHNANWPNGVNQALEFVNDEHLSTQRIIPSPNWPDGLTAAIKQRIES